MYKRQPLIIIGFVAPGIADLGAGAGKTLAATTGVAYGSTIISGTLAFVVASLLYPHMVHAGMFMELSLIHIWITKFRKLPKMLL